jgi:hypothetical protein
MRLILQSKLWTCLAFTAAKLSSISQSGQAEIDTTGGILSKKLL